MKNLFCVTLVLFVTNLASKSEARERDWFDKFFGIGKPTPSSVSHSTPRPLFGGCPPGTPTIRCGRLNNGLGKGLAIVVARVDNNPIVITPCGGNLALPRILDGEDTAFVWPACTRRDPKTGNCWYRFVGIAYETINVEDLFPAGTNPALHEMPSVKSQYRHCFLKDVLVSTSMMRRDFIPSIQEENLLGTCPQGIIPKTAATAK